MVRWYHAIFSAYGFWLPNDPRGSWSDFVHAWEPFRYGGPATTVTGKRSFAHDAHDRNFRREMQEHLKFPPARFDENAQQSIAAAIARAVSEFGFPIHAMSIGFDHIHGIFGRDPARSIEQVIAVLKARATNQMNLDETNPMRGFPGSPTPWGKSCWSVFINDEKQLANAIAYVERHPMKEGMKRQEWSFVVKPQL